MTHEYKTINDYHQDFEAKFGHEPGKPIADDFTGAREPLDHEAPTKRPGSLDEEGIGRGSPGDDAKIRDATTPEPGESGGTRSQGAGADECRRGDPGDEAARAVPARRTSARR